MHEHLSCMGGWSLSAGRQSLSSKGALRHLWAVIVHLWVGDGHSWVAEMVICGWGMVVIGGDGIVIRRCDVEQAKE